MKLAGARAQSTGSRQLIFAAHARNDARCTYCGVYRHYSTTEWTV